ncbi:MAG: helix-turn-helix domain-containing protein [Bacteroidota bacterium]
MFVALDVLKNELLFFFSALGVFNAFLAGTYLIFSGLKQRNPYLLSLGGLLFLIVLRVGVSCFYFFLGTIHPLLIQLGLTANVLAGVALFILMKTDKTSFAKRDALHFFLLFFTLIVFGWLYPYHKHFPVWDFEIRYAMHALLTVYIGFAGLRLLSKKKRHKELFKQKRIVFVAFVAICLGFAISLFTNYVLGPIFFSIIFYGSLILLSRTNAFFKKSFQEKYAGKKINSLEAALLKEKMDQYLFDSSLFKNPDFKINALAKAMNVAPQRISQVLNDNFDISFSHYINAYRVEEAKKLLQSRKDITIEAIGLEAGFRSKSSFFSIFRQKTGYTPKAFLKTTPEIEN